MPIAMYELGSHTTAHCPQNVHPADKKKKQAM